MVYSNMKTTYFLIYVQIPENNNYIERKLLSPKFKE